MLFEESRRLKIKPSEIFKCRTVASSRQHEALASVIFFFFFFFCFLKRKKVKADEYLARKIIRRSRKAIAKSQTLWLQRCLMLIFIIWAEVLIIKEVLGVYTPIFGDPEAVENNLGEEKSRTPLGLPVWYRLTNNAFTAGPKSFRGFRETGPSTKTLLRCVIYSTLFGDGARSNKSIINW